MHRRRFLTASITAGALTSVLQGAERPRNAFPVEPRERLAVSSYPFRSLIRGVSRDSEGLNKSGMTLEQFVQSVVSRLQVKGIEPWSHHFESSQTDYVRGLHDSFKKAGAHVVNIAVDLSLHLCDSDSQARAAGLDQYRKWVDAAVILGSPSIRVHVPSKAEGKGDVQCALDNLGVLAKYGAERKVVINLENDEPGTEDPFTIVQLIKSAESPFLRALPDFCNSMLISDDPDYNHRGLQAMFPYAFNISHVKDSESDKGKVYNVNLAEIFDIAKKAHYQGYFSIEWEGTGDPYQGTSALIRQSIEALG